MIDDFSPMYQGDTGIPFAPIFARKDGSLVNLSGVSISMKMINLEDTEQIKTCSGSWVIDDPTNGKAHYNWQSSDVDTPGEWEIYVEVVGSGGPFHADPKTVTILQVPS